jgi:hypothetical protein
MVAMHRDSDFRGLRAARTGGSAALLAALLACGAAAGCSSAPKGEPTAKDPAPSGESGNGERIALPTSAKPESSAASTELPGTAPTDPGAGAEARPEAPADVQAALDYDPADPLGDLESADALDSAGAAPSDAAPPDGGCVVTHNGRRVWPAPGPATVASVGQGFAVAGYARRDGKEQLFLAHVPASGAPEPITAFTIDPPHPSERVAPPGLAARDDNDLIVAFTDGEGVLHARRLRIGRGGSGGQVEIARGVDTRFAPAVASHEDRTLVAWTQGSTPMRVHLAVLDEGAKVLQRHDLTPPTMGAAAPAFIDGATPPALVAVDARDGVSPIVRIDLRADLTPTEGQVAAAVGMVSSPPELAAASSPAGTYVAYTGLGSAATSAVGLVAISPVVGSPEAMVPGTAYGQLHVAAAAAPRGLLFAADAPIEPGKKPPHEIRLHLITPSGAGEPVSLRGPGGRAAHASIARDDRGEVAVAYTADSGVYVASARCDDQ